MTINNNKCKKYSTNKFLLTKKNITIMKPFLFFPCWCTKCKSEQLLSCSNYRFSYKVTPWHFLFFLLRKLLETVAKVKKLASEVALYGLKIKC